MAMAFLLVAMAAGFILGARWLVGDVGNYAPTNDGRGLPTDHEAADRRE